MVLQKESWNKTTFSRKWNQKDLTSERVEEIYRVEENPEINTEQFPKSWHNRKIVFKYAHEIIFGVKVSKIRKQF